MPKDIRRQYYLDPFPTHTDTAIALTKKKYQLKTNCYVFGSPLLENGLGNVENVATLLIDGHGFERDPTTIVADFRTTTLGYPVDKLGDMIANYWRLPKGHIKIRMLSCWGYGFARQLAIKLGTQGYDRIHVAGYKGPVKTGVYDTKTGRGRNPVQIGDDEYNYEKTRIEWYDRHGNIVPKPDVGATAVVGTSDSEWD